MKKKNIAVVSTALPPSASGQAKVLERLLRGQPDTDYWFLSDNQSTFTQAPGEGFGKYIKTAGRSFGLVKRRLPGFLDSLNSRLGAMRPIRERADEIVNLLSEAPPSVVIGCSGNPFDLPASALSAERLGARFLAYIFDDNIYQWPAGPLRDHARRFEKIWLPRAEAIICPNEVVAAEIKGRTGRDPVIIRNPVNDTVVAASPVSPTIAADGPVRIVYTGSIYHAHRDAFENLLAAMSLAPARYRLEIYSHQPQGDLMDYGLFGPSVRWNAYLSDTDIVRVQRAADMLFLPLAFKSTIQDVLMSSAPGKMAEYLLSGRPVLVHAPAGSFVSTFFSDHQAGYVVDQPFVSDVARALDILSTDLELAARLAGNAQTAGQEFTAAESRRRFWQLIGEGSKAPP